MYTCTHAPKGSGCVCVVMATNTRRISLRGRRPHRRPNFFSFPVHLFFLYKEKRRREKTCRTWTWTSFPILIPFLLLFNDFLMIIETHFDLAFIIPSILYLKKSKKTTPLKRKCSWFLYISLSIEAVTLGWNPKIIGLSIRTQTREKKDVSEQ